MILRGFQKNNPKKMVLVLKKANYDLDFFLPQDFRWATHKLIKMQNLFQPIQFLLLKFHGLYTSFQTSKANLCWSRFEKIFSSYLSYRTWNYGRMKLWTHKLHRWKINIPSSLIFRFEVSKVMLQRKK